ncbi:hypothetical protein E1293_22855 [Actinomadura darangshiensis]|uniref:Uncharacterized protein n=1 Tax=Actinomadura darangshiensis TaxID=705336 RepID=A0A4R5B492_9ACTN|nr:hypothetical protein [Actinomadura darangshiensis]TDD79589.1 hypothetical protein E1293_22855 [Actinomadura darangshiensis]
MTAVVLAGDFPSTGILRASVAQRIALDGAGGDTAPAFIDHMARALQTRGAVLVVYPEWKGKGTRRLVQLARAALLTDRIAGVALDLPPIALSLVADQLTFASSYARPGVLVGLAHRLRETLYAGAWVNSVARLEHIKTGLGAHVSSYLPGGAFAVTAGCQAGVHRITAAKPVPDLGARPGDPVLMLFGGTNGDTEWLQQKLRPAVAAVSATLVAPQPLGAEYWGTKKYVEFVAFSGHPQALQSLLSDFVYRPCGWCGEPTALPHCPLCQMTQPAPPPSPEAVQDQPADVPAVEADVPVAGADVPVAGADVPVAGAGADRTPTAEADEIAVLLQPAPRRPAAADPRLIPAPRATSGDEWPRAGTVAFGPRDRP